MLIIIIIKGANLRGANLESSIMAGTGTWQSLTMGRAMPQK